MLQMEWALVGRGEGDELSQVIKTLKSKYHNRSFESHIVQGASHSYDGYDATILDFVVPWLSKSLR